MLAVSIAMESGYHDPDSLGHQLNNPGLLLDAQSKPKRYMTPEMGWEALVTLLKSSIDRPVLDILLDFEHFWGEDFDNRVERISKYTLLYPYDLL